MIKKTTLAVVVASWAVAATAEEFAINDLVVNDVIAGATTPVARAGAGYMTITNTGETDDALVSVQAEFPRVEMHNSVMKNDVMSMEQTERVDLPAGETVTFERGGLHVMFMGLNGDPFEVGETVSATLVFENAGELEVTFVVAEIKKDGHGGH